MGVILFALMSLFVIHILIAGTLMALSDSVASNTAAVTALTAQVAATVAEIANLQAQIAAGVDPALIAQIDTNTAATVAATAALAGA